MEEGLNIMLFSMALARMPGSAGSHDNYYLETVALLCSIVDRSVFSVGRALDRSPPRLAPLRPLICMVRCW